MPTFDVTGPDGVKHRVNVPEGKTRQDAIRYIADTKYNVQPSQAAQSASTPEDRTTADNAKDFMEGLALSGANMREGLTDLATRYGPEFVQKAVADWTVGDAEFRDKIEAEALESGWGDVGKFTGDVLKYAVPGGATARMVSTGGKMLPLTTEAATAGGVGFLTETGDVDQRTDQAVEDVAATLTGQAAGGVLKKAMEGIKRTPAADQLIQKGVRLTPGQAAEGPLPRAAEYVMRFTPFLAKGANEARDQAVEDWSVIALKEAAPKGMSGRITEAGLEGNKQLKDAYSDAYAKAWSQAELPTAESMKGMFELAESGAENLSKESANVLTRQRDNAAKYLENPTPLGLKELDNKLRKAIRSASTSRDPNMALIEVLDGMRAELRAGIGETAEQAVKEVDSTYGNYLAVRRGATGAKELAAGGVLSPEALMRGSKAVGGETRAFTGAAPMQDFAQEGIEVLAKKEPNPIVDAVKGLALNTPTIPGMQTAGRAMLGETAPQRTLQQITDSAIVSALRSYGLTPGNIAAASDMYDY